MSRVNLFVIGVNKAGTSWLYHLLNQHPAVFMSEVKELYFFDDHDRGPADISDYHEHFPFEADYRYFGDATPMYYRTPSAADAIYRYNPDAKLLAIVRDPIQRLLSQYRYHKQIGLLDESTSVSTALDGRDPMLLQDSHYERTLPAFVDRFGHDRVKIVSLESAKDTPREMWQELLNYLNVPAAPYPSLNDRPENPTGSFLFRLVYRTTIVPTKRYAPGLYQRMLRSPAVRTAKRILLSILGTADEETIPNEVHDRLRQEFAPTYRYLDELGFDHYPSP
jgi:hypothetical protein